MAGGHVWGLDIGQCGLKALRGQLSSDGELIEVDSFDFIEYPQILSQPDANPTELVRDALKTFLSRNTLRGDRVAISLSGQSGLARFIKLPPVDSKQLPNLVGFEAKQQIPFALEDVVWDYQQIPGTSLDELPAGDDADDDEDGEDDFPMETEVGLFAIKRDQVLRAIRPLMDAEVELDYIQLAPLAIYNAVSFDRIRSDEGFNPDKADSWVAVLSMGTDNSDLVVTNGFRVWQRSIPIGGSNFTKRLTKDLKLTFAKAEHVKRNARDAKDAKQIFQAMRSVFSELVTEVQRSIGYFSSLERSANVEKLVLYGNAAKLPGLPQYIEKNLEIPVDKPRQYERLSGASVIEDATFTDNLLSYAVTYGLILQGVGKGQINTNLVPPELITARLIRRKKPWAAAIAAAILLACAFNFFFIYRAWDSVHADRTVNNVSWTAVKNKVNSVKSEVSSYESNDSQKVEELARLDRLGEEAIGSDDGRKLWLELLKTITDCLPTDESLADGQMPSIKDRPLETRPEIFIESIESQFFEDVSTWNTAEVQAKYQEFLNNRAGDKVNDAKPANSQSGDATEDGATDEPPAEPETAAVEPAVAEDNEDRPPVEGPGWVIQLQGHHFKTEGFPKNGEYVRRTLMEQLESGRVHFETPDGASSEFRVKEMGILSPILVSGGNNLNVRIANPDYKPNTRGENRGGPGSERNRQNPRNANANANADPDNPAYFTPNKYEFTIQFVWKQIKLSERIKAAQERQRLEQEEAQ